jgi:polygalacturonase
MPSQPLNRRDALRLGAKLAAATALSSTLSALPVFAGNNRRPVPVFDVGKYGAVGDGVTLDTAAIQRAIDEAAAAGGGAQVLVRGGRRYLIGTLQLKAGIDFHLADDAELLVSTRPEDFAGAGAALTAREAHGLRLTGTGSINGRSREFMTGFDPVNEWWRPKSFRPRLLALTGCKDLEVRDLTLTQAPSWTVHLLGCEDVLVDNLKIRNQLDVPNCDGIDPDHCRDVEIRNCHIVCGDDAIVLKTTRAGAAYGPCAKITIRDCQLETQDAGVKIGTETTDDIHDIRIERCKIVSSCRGLGIQLRDEGSVYNVDFREIEFVSRYHSDPWWGRGEAISFTAIPRAPQTRIGTIRDVRVQNVSGRAENSVRINGTPESRIRDVRFENVGVTLDRWTKYPGGLFDNRPTTALPGIEPHGTPGFSLRHADNVLLKNCRVTWGQNLPDYFTHALEAEAVTGLTVTDFTGPAAHPDRFKAVRIL